MRREVLGLWVDKALRTEAEEAQRRRGDEEEAAGRRNGEAHAESVEGLRRGEGRARRRREEVLRGLLHGDGGGGDVEVRRGGGLPRRALRGDGGGGSTEESRRGEGSARNLLCDGSGGDMEGPRREEAQQRLLRGDGSGGDAERVWRGEAESGGPRRSVGNTGAEGLRRGQTQHVRQQRRHRQRRPRRAGTTRASSAARSGLDFDMHCLRWRSAWLGERSHEIGWALLTPSRTRGGLQACAPPWRRHGGSSKNDAVAKAKQPRGELTLLRRGNGRGANAERAPDMSERFARC